MAERGGLLGGVFCASGADLGAAVPARICLREKLESALMVADLHRTSGVHTPSMSLKTAALLALIGMILLTIVAVVGFVVNMAGWIHGVVSAIRVLTSLIYMVASLGVTVFFWVFYRKQA